MITFENGSIIKKTAFHERVLYATGNNKAAVEFDATGAISKYAVMNKYSVFSCFYTLFSINDQAFNWDAEKTVTMNGRMQTTCFNIQNCKIEIKQFLDQHDNGVYSEFIVTAKDSIKFDIVINYGIDYLSYVEQLPTAGRLSFKNILRLIGGLLKKKKTHKSVDGDFSCIRNDISGDLYVDFASNVEIKPLEKWGGFCIQFNLNGTIEGGDTKSFKLVTSAGSRHDSSFTDALTLVKNFDEKRTACYEHEKSLVSMAPQNCKENPMHLAYYCQLLNCALSNYKELGKFKGFLAGVVYQFPARTYFRDGYWTCLAALNTRPSLVRDEIITLGRGINSKTGDCPSAVKYNFKNHWANHYDSPSFFSLMIHDYIVATGDRSILDVVVNKKSILELAEKALTKLINATDHTGMLVKEGKYNRRDWCDNVFRRGYVSYDIALYARALYSLSEFYRIKKDDIKTLYYEGLFEKAKRSLNEKLWSEEKGWFINYIDGDVVEDNLSIDTMIIPLFGLCDELRAMRMLTNAERLLETKNNKEQCAGDFGTLCVYPFYKNADATVQKSSFPYFYHNGGDWPYLSNIYAYTKYIYGMDGDYPLFRWFECALERGKFTPTEFYSPFHPEGSSLQAWSSTGAFVLANKENNFFAKNL
ncbi:MAG: hypothetical protein LBF68_04050 [Christensenellaceae bacterium]|jgi:hypothetical protein|nr:hypothetical protein [Christensenellaceae bacterium]